MKTIALIGMLLGIVNTATAGVDEGTVIALDGQGSLTVKTLNNGTMIMQANKRLMNPDPATKTASYPDCYKDLKIGDQIKINWGHDRNTLQKAAGGIRILKPKKLD